MASRDRVLCLDGGGIRGLIILEILEAIEKEAGQPIKEMFDWIGGTSTGGIIALAIATGKPISRIKEMYMRIKDQVFKGLRPYDSAPLETLLKQEFGEATVMSDIRYPKVLITSVEGDHDPWKLHLFRSYTVVNDDLEDGCEQIAEPQNHYIWEVARCTSAAPSYFHPYKQFLDGGLMSNNPTLDILTDIHQFIKPLPPIQHVDKNDLPLPQIQNADTNDPPLKQMQNADKNDPPLPQMQNVDNNDPPLSQMQHAEKNDPELSPNAADKNDQHLPQMKNADKNDLLLPQMQNADKDEPSLRQMQNADNNDSPLSQMQNPDTDDPSLPRMQNTDKNDPPLPQMQNAKTNDPPLSQIQNANKNDPPLPQMQNADQNDPPLSQMQNADKGDSVDEADAAKRQMIVEVPVRYLDVVVSVGCRYSNYVKQSTPDPHWPDLSDMIRHPQKTYRLLTETKRFFKSILEQVSISYGQPTHRARAWCKLMNVPFYRFSPLLSENVPLDCVDEKRIERMLQETKFYIEDQKNQQRIKELAHRLRRFQ